MPSDLLIQQVDPEACHLINHPKRLWVFGGACDNCPNPVKSLRDSFWRQTLHPLDLSVPEPQWFANLDRPEEYPNWWAFSGYKDLLQFERDACYLARAIILFAESPGALVELGALAIDDFILRRLFVVIQNKQLNEDYRESFINLGPIKRVEPHKGKCVISTSSGSSLLEDDFEAIIESINNWLLPSSQTSVFQPENPTHRLLLLADLVDLLIICKESELKKAAAHFNVNMTDIELTRALKLLDFFQLVKLEIRGNNEYFWVRRARSEAPWINYTAIKGNSFDRSRFKTKCNELIVEDKRKKSVLERSQ